MHSTIHFVKITDYIPYIRALFGTESSKRTPRLSGKRPTARFSLFSPPTFIHSIIAWLAMPQRATDARCLAGFFCVFRGNAAPTPSQTRPKKATIVSFRLGQQLICYILHSFNWPPPSSGCMWPTFLSSPPHSTEDVVNHVR